MSLEALTEFYTNIFKGRPRRRRALYGDPLADLQKYGGKHGLTPIRKDADDDDDEIDDGAARRLVAQDQDQDDEADEDDEDNEGEDEQAKTKHLVSDLADLIAEGSEGSIDRPTALRHLLHTAHGNALVHRLRGAQKRLEQGKENAMPKWEDVAKCDGGGDAIVAHVLKGDTSLDQQSLTKHLTTAAQRQYPNLRPDVAFAKAFESNESWRRAMLSVRGF